MTRNVIIIFITVIYAVKKDNIFGSKKKNRKLYALLIVTSTYCGDTLFQH